MESALPNSQSRYTTTTDKSILAGIITGQLAGLIMAIVVMLVFTLFLGKGPLYPVQVIGSMLFGESALIGFHPGAFFAGLVLHQAGPSLLWGFVYGVIARTIEPKTKLASVGIGLIVGVVSMIGPYLLIPAIMNSVHGVDIWNREVPLFWDWAAHIVFGISFFLFPLIQQKLIKY